MRKIVGTFMAHRTRNITLENIKDTLMFNFEDGTLRWRERPSSYFRSQKASDAWNRRYAGGAPTVYTHNGYERITLFHTTQFVHRLIFAVFNGVEPAEMPVMIDHVDGNRLNNIPSNLRSANATQNCINTKALIPDRKGVQPVDGRWRVRIQAYRKRIHVGFFDTKDEAIAAYRGAAVVLHGGFRRET